MYFFRFYPEWCLFFPVLRIIYFATTDCKIPFLTVAMCRFYFKCYMYYSIIFQCTVCIHYV